MQSVDPTTGDVTATYAETPPDTADAHIQRAHRLQMAWSQVSIAERSVCMNQLAMVLLDRRDDLAKLMAREMGKPVTQGRAEVEKCAWVCRYYAEEAATILEDDHIETGRTKSYVAYRPLGVVLGVMPWNFPLWQVIRFAAPSLMAGNACILKHASNVTGCSLAIDEMIVEAGFPDGLFRSVIVPSDRVAELIEHPRVAAVTLTGSDGAGRSVGAKAGGQLKKTVLELGGADPYLVLADADVDLAVAACSFGRLLNAGQSCIAAKRFIVHSSIIDEFTTKLVKAMDGYIMGNPLEESTELGPMARVDLRDEIHGQVTKSVRAGARVITGGVIPDGPGAFYPPTILTDVAEGMPAYHEETFGPVASIIVFDDEEDAIRIANDSVFGLGAAVFTRDVERGERIARDRIEAGSCFVNSFVVSDPRLPFGGIKASGHGRELSDIGIREFLNVKTVVVK